MSKANVTTCDACGETTTVDCPYIGGGWYKIEVSGYSREGDKPEIERKLDACSPACVADAMREVGDRISPARVVSPAAPAALDGPVDPVARASLSIHEVEGIKANTFAHEADVEAKPSADCAFDPRATVEERKVVATELPSRLAEEGGGGSRVLTFLLLAAAVAVVLWLVFGRERPPEPAPTPRSTVTTLVAPAASVAPTTSVPRSAAAEVARGG